VGISASRSVGGWVKRNVDAEWILTSARTKFGSRKFARAKSPKAGARMIKFVISHLQKVISVRPIFPSFLRDYSYGFRGLGKTL